MAYLHKKKSIKEFVIWGRSMGAVAALLYATKNHTQRPPSKRKEKHSMSTSQSMKNSAVNSKREC